SPLATTCPILVWWTVLQRTAAPHEFAALQRTIQDIRAVKRAECQDSIIHYFWDREQEMDMLLEAVGSSRNTHAHCPPEDGKNCTDKCIPRRSTFYYPTTSETPS